MKTSITIEGNLEEITEFLNRSPSRQAYGLTIRDAADLVISSNF
jgi:hypothetical protein